VSSAPEAAGGRLDGVFEGGGVKGIGLVGALSVIEAKGYRFFNVAGTSAGAIVAALVAAGYTAAELKQTLMQMEFNQFLDTDLVGKIPFVGAVADELLAKGLYKGNYFENLMRQLLARKGVRTFGDLVLREYADSAKYRFKLRVVTSDITQGRMVILPQDIVNYGMAPEDLEVALAVRMSMSIPFFFIPVRLGHCYFVDGGLLSNFPVEIFDSDGPPEWPTFGFRLVRADEPTPAAGAPTGATAGTRADAPAIDPAANGRQTLQVVRHPIQGPLSELMALFFTAMQAHDAYYLQNDKFVRTITIDTLDVTTTDFNLSQQKKAALYQSGVAAAQSFLTTWDFDAYKAVYRSGQPVPTRRDLVLPRGAAATR
jgi:NTE family protein